MKVEDIMQRDVIKVKHSYTIKEVSKKMKEHNVGRVPVVDDEGNVIGIVTDRDIVISGIAKDNGFYSNTIDTIMTRQVVYITPDRDVTEALELMGLHKIRSLLVIRGNTLVGMITLGDILQTFRYSEKVLETLNKIYSKD